MLTDRDIQTVIYQLIQNGIVQFPMEGELVTMSIYDGGRKYSLSTAVYASVGRYVPHSVRHCVLQAPLGQEDRLRTFVQVHEESYRVFLHSLGSMSHMDHHTFREVLREFAKISNRWRLLLDEHGRNDLSSSPYD